MQEDQVWREEGALGVKAVMPEKHLRGEKCSQQTMSRAGVILDCWSLKLWGGMILGGEFKKRRRPCFLKNCDTEWLGRGGQAFERTIPRGQRRVGEQGLGHCRVLPSSSSSPPTWCSLPRSCPLPHSLCFLVLPNLQPVLKSQPWFPPLYNHVDTSSATSAQAH